MSTAYDEIVDFIAATNPNPMTVATFEPSQATKDRVADLIHREKTVGLTTDEELELKEFMHLEHIMRLAKARARGHLAHE
jgi:hypothetical protein